MKKIFLTIALITPIIYGCNFFNGDNASESKSAPDTFPYPKIPAIINSNEDAAAYMAVHFWKGYFDSTEVWNANLPAEVLDEAFRTYINILWEVPFNKAMQAQKNLTGRLASRRILSSSSAPKDSLFDYFTENLRNALYGANSDLRNEDLYVPVLEMLCNDSLTDETDKLTYRFELDKCNLNRTGSKAADFSFRQANGRHGNLYGIKSEYTLLLFSNPGCQACASIVQQFSASEQLVTLFNAGIVSILNVYIDDDLEAWRSHLPDFPQVWTNAYNDDFTVRNGVTYDVRAIPSIYLLDKDKNVIFKDISPNMFLAKLHNLR